MRIRHLEGLRGLACLQVMALHALGAFRPGLVDGPAAPWELAVRHSPLRLLYDGDAAVFLFFVLSGFVLSAPFRRDAARPLHLLAARLVRFLVPALMACALGWATWRLLGQAAPRAGAAIGAGWLLGGLAGTEGLAGLLRDATVNALALGYRDLSAFSPWLALWPNQASLDPPLWTLSVEMQGALLVLGLVQAERLSRRAWIAALVLAGLACLRSPLLCFLAGHAAASLGAPPRGWRGPAALLGLALVAGLGDAPAALLDAAALPLLPALEPGLTLRGWAAILVFPALLHAAPSRRLLGRALPCWLGRWSFPLYLVHWPMLFGPGAAAMLALAPALGVAAAAWCGIAAGLAASLLLAAPFAAVDGLALGLARRLRNVPDRAQTFLTQHVNP